MFGLFDVIGFDNGVVYIEIMLILVGLLLLVMVVNLSLFLFMLLVLRSSCSPGMV